MKRRKESDDLTRIDGDIFVENEIMYIMIKGEKVVFNSKKHKEWKKEKEKNND